MMKLLDSISTFILCYLIVYVTFLLFHVDPIVNAFVSIVVTFIAVKYIRRRHQTEDAKKIRNNITSNKPVSNVVKEVSLQDVCNEIIPLCVNQLTRISKEQKKSLVSAMLKEVADDEFPSVYMFNGSNLYQIIEQSKWIWKEWEYWKPIMIHNGGYTCFTSTEYNEKNNTPQDLFNLFLKTTSSRIMSQFEARRCESVGLEYYYQPIYEEEQKIFDFSESDKYSPWQEKISPKMPIDVILQLKDNIT